MDGGGVRGRRGGAPLVVALVLGAVCAAGCAHGSDGFRTYEEGYRFGSGAPRGHLSTDGDDAEGGDPGYGSASSECGEHAVFEREPATGVFTSTGIFHDRLKVSVPFPVDLDLTTVGPRRRGSGPA